jgi:putative tRNA adenosine deaminase-associated protein
MPENAGADFAIVAYREEGRWEVAPLPARTGEDLAALVAALRQLPAEGGTLGVVSVADDFFVVVRASGDEISYLLSDVTAASEWLLAREILDALELPMPEGDDLDKVQPAGDLDILADLGVPAVELGAICDDLELYPDEMLARIANRLGFGEQFDRVVDSALR